MTDRFMNPQKPLFFPLKGQKACHSILNIRWQTYYILQINWFGRGTWDLSLSLLDNILYLHLAYVGTIILFLFCKREYFKEYRRRIGVIINERKEHSPSFQEIPWPWPTSHVCPFYSCYFTAFCIFVCYSIFSHYKFTVCSSNSKANKSTAHHGNGCIESATESTNIAASRASSTWRHFISALYIKYNNANLLTGCH